MAADEDQVGFGVGQLFIGRPVEVAGPQRAIAGHLGGSGAHEVA